MARDSLSGFQPPLMDRLLDDSPDLAFEETVRRRFSLDEIKQSVARDLESLLNTRSVAVVGVSAGFPLTGRSLLSYGLEDFVGRSLLNPDDRNRICRALEESITIHEPRLKKIRVTIDASNQPLRTLKFRVSAILHVEPMREPVDFDAMLQPNTQHYVVMP
jgi:type VI secretion system protein ImpF